LTAEKLSYLPAKTSYRLALHHSDNELQGEPMRMKKIVAALLMTVGIAQVAQAQEWQEPDYPLRGFYGGFDLGAWRLRFAGTSLELKGFTYSPFLGYQINRYLGLEAAYIGGSDATQNVGGIELSMRAHVAEASLIGSIPLTGYAGLYARAGLARWWSTTTLSVQGFSASEDDRGTNGAYGAGVYQHFGAVAARIEYTRASVRDARVSRFTAAAYWRF
jgi:outer membrane protein with beta-barrel domain